MGTSTAIGSPAIATVVLLVPLAVLDRRMQKTGGPGIIPFELAGPKGSVPILRRWGTEGRRAATLSLVLDFPFLASYTVLNVRVTRRARDARGHHGMLVPRIAEAAQLLAGACDAVENSALLVTIARSGDEGMAGIAQLAARAKFTLLGLGWLYSTAALFGILHRR
jgi:hypothetical protein